MKPPTLSRELPRGRKRYCLCFFSAEDAAEGPSEDDFKPSAVDLATCAVAKWRSGPTWVSWISTTVRLLPSTIEDALAELAGYEGPHSLLESAARVLGDRPRRRAAGEAVVSVLPLAVVFGAVDDRD